MKRGRRRTITPELTKQVCELLSDGNFINTVCQYVGIGVSTYYKWCTRGEEELQRVEDGEIEEVRKEERIFVEFVEATTRARARSEVDSVAIIRKAAKKDWKAASFFLERSHNERWGRSNKVDVTSGGEKLDGPVLYMPTLREDDETE